MRYDRDGFSVEAAIQKGRSLPEWYLAEPDVGDADPFFMQAFSDLSTMRQQGYSPGPIPWDKAMLWAAHKGLDESLTDLFMTVIRVMDNAWLEWHSKQLEKSREVAKVKKNG